jgi:hypothetical protein
MAPTPSQRLQRVPSPPSPGGSGMAPTPFREAPTPPIARDPTQEGEGGARYPDLRIGGDQGHHTPPRSACREGFAQPQVVDTGDVTMSSDASPPLQPRFHPPAASPTRLPALPAAALRLRLHPPPSLTSALPRSTASFSRPTPHHYPSPDEPAEPPESPTVQGYLAHGGLQALKAEARACKTVQIHQRTGPKRHCR